MQIPAWTYRQHAKPGQTEFGGWHKDIFEIPMQTGALAVMHAWGNPAPGQYPGWERCINYIPRARKILAEVFPPLLAVARAKAWPLIHVAGWKEYYRHLPGYRRTRSLSDPTPPPDGCAIPDPGIDALRLRLQHESFPGRENLADIEVGTSKLDFDEVARPVGDEWIVEDDRQLNAVCQHLGVSHLVYIGFAINWCLLLSPGGMLDMERRGYFCSTIREATTAVESGETNATEANKAEGLWRVALRFGLVFDLPDFMNALQALPQGVNDGACNL